MLKNKWKKICVSEESKSIQKKVKHTNKTVNKIHEIVKNKELEWWDRVMKKVVVEKEKVEVDVRNRAVGRIRNTTKKHFDKEMWMERNGEIKWEKEEKDDMKQDFKNT